MNSSETAGIPAEAPPRIVPHSRVLVSLAMSLFFAFGFCTVLVDTLTPKLKGLFALSYAEVMLTPFAFFGAYFLLSMPAAWLLPRIGYLQSVVLGLLVTALGCALYTPAAQAGVYEAFLAATFVMASGVTIVQVAANPLTAAVGHPGFSHSRLTLAHSFNSLATMIGPIFGSALILGHGDALPSAGSLPVAVLAQLRREEAQAVQGPFLGIALSLLILAVVCALFFRLAPKPARPAPGGYARLLRRPRLMFGALTIFAYVGAEVTIGSFLTNYLMSAHSFGAPLMLAGSLVSVYWGLAMVGRFIGVGALRRLDPGRLLALCAAGAVALCLVSGLGSGFLAGGAILAIGLCNSIMFPTIFALAIEGLGEQTPQGSGLLCLGIVGGAVVPLVSGGLADTAGLPFFLVIPGLCYLWIASYGRLTAARRRPSALGGMEQEVAPAT